MEKQPTTTINQEKASGCVLTVSNPLQFSIVFEKSEVSSRSAEDIYRLSTTLQTEDGLITRSMFCDFAVELSAHNTNVLALSRFHLALGTLLRLQFGKNEAC